MEATTSLPKYGRQQIEALGASSSLAPPSILEAPKLELKELPQHLRYAFLGSKLPVIIFSSLIGDEEEKTLTCAKKSQNSDWLDNCGYKRYKPFSLYAQDLDGGEL